MNVKNQILSQLLNDSSLYFRYSDRIHPGLFDDPKTQSVLNAYKAVIKDNGKPDTASVALKHADPDAFAWIVDIATEVDYSNTFESLLLTQEDDYIKREVKMLAHQLDSPNKSGTELLEIIKTKIFDLNAQSPKKGVWISDEWRSLLKHIKESISGQVPSGVRTGIKFYDSRVGGFFPSDFIVLAGKTSMGKTSFALTFAKDMAKFGTPVGIFSLEMSNSQLATRVLSSESFINGRDINAHRLNDAQVARMTEVSKSLGDLPIMFLGSGSKLESILNEMRKSVIVHGIKVFIVDYIQLVQNHAPGKGREQEVAEVARAFKNIAKELDVPVVGLSQLKRESDGRDRGKEPTLSDLRDSGQIEEAADTVMFLHRPEYYGINEFEDGSPTAGKVKVIIAKGRNSGVFYFYMDFDANLTKFHNIEELSNGAIF